MRYVGIYTQQVNNNMKSLLLLLLFPCIIVGCVYAFFLILAWMQTSEYSPVPDWDWVNQSTFEAMPFVVGAVALWFVIAFFFNSYMIRRSTGARPLLRKENPRVYNIVENLCIACGMDMPKVFVVDTPQLNAYASGIGKDSYAVTLTTGICDELTDGELAGVVGHELTHIRNRDTRLLIVSIIFVGIMTFVMRFIYYFIMRISFSEDLSSRRSSKNEKGGGAALAAIALVALVVAFIGNVFTVLTRFAISRKREYMADAGGAELCGDSLALASALRKISRNPGLGDVSSEDVSQLFIARPQAFTKSAGSFLNNLFSTHPSIESRIAYLEQF